MRASTYAPSSVSVLTTFIALGSETSISVITESEGLIGSICAVIAGSGSSQ